MTPAVRSQISSELIFPKAVCCTPIARITGRVIIKDTGWRLPLELQCVPGSTG